MMQKSYLLTLFILLSTTLAASDIYQRFTMRQTDIDAVLDNAIISTIASKTQLPADISYVCADIKSDGEKLTFCECGDGIYMSFRAADVELNGHKQNVVSPYWGIFWHYLKRFNLPIWHVGATGPAHAMAMHELEKVGGMHFQNLQELAKDPLFKRISQQPFNKTNAIKSHKGIIVYRAKTEQTRDCKAFIDFQKNHPQFLFVNALARDHIKRKDHTYSLFHKAHLDQHIPRHKVYSTSYNQTLAQQICNDIDSELLIIKPVFSSLSNGVNAIDRGNLDNLLKLILRDKNDIELNAHRCFGHWRRSHAGSFIASEYVPSKTIYKDKKPYDPTMRVVFMLHHDNNVITTTLIAGFWKIPVKSLTDNVSHTDQRITIAHAGAYYSGIMMDNQDWYNIKNILHAILPQLYETMLTQEA